MHFSATHLALFSAALSATTILAAPSPAYASSPAYAPSPVYNPSPVYTSSPAYAPSPGYASSPGYTQPNQCLSCQANDYSQKCLPVSGTIDNVLGMVGIGIGNLPVVGNVLSTVDQLFSEILCPIPVIGYLLPAITASATIEITGIDSTVSTVLSQFTVSVGALLKLSDAELLGSSKLGAFIQIIAQVTNNGDLYHNIAISTDVGAQVSGLNILLNSYINISASLEVNAGLTTVLSGPLDSIVSLLRRIITIASSQTAVLDLSVSV